MLRQLFFKLLGISELEKKLKHLEYAIETVEARIKVSEHRIRTTEADMNAVYPRMYASTGAYISSMTLSTDDGMNKCES